MDKNFCEIMDFYTMGIGKETISIKELRSSMDWISQAIKEIKNIESPMEELFIVSLIKQIIINNEEDDLNKNLLFFNGDMIEGYECDGLYPDEYFDNTDAIMISINKKVGKYKPDVIIFGYINKKITKLIFEIDGYKFHNTKEKLTQDKQRERYLQQLGFKVYRFSGTEIYGDARETSENAYQILINEFNLK